MPYLYVSTSDVELECLNIALPRSLRELLYELTGREIGQ